MKDTHINILSSAVTAVAICIGSSIYAEGLDVDQGSSERVSAAAHLQTLVQQVAASACEVAVNDVSGASPTSFDAVIAEYGKIIQALRFGDPSLGIIGQEQRRQTLAAIDSVNVAAIPLLELIDGYKDAENDIAKLSDVSRESDVVLQMSSDLLVEVTRQYVDDVTLLQGDAMLIRAFNRQVTLSAGIEKEACLVHAGIDMDITLAELQADVDLFQNSLTGLANGIPALSIAPPTPEVAAILDGILAEWDGVKPLLGKAVSTKQLSSDDLDTVASTMSEISAELMEIVSVQVKNAKLGV